MRISTRQPTTIRARRRPPSVRKRVAYGVVGLAIGGVLGYGIATAGPQTLPLTDPVVLTWTLGLAVVCGLLAAAGADRILTYRSIRSAGTRMDDA